MDRVLRACEASLVILHITTAPGMPKQVYMEEVIEHLVSFCRFQLENTIYPEYDPVYRVDPDSKCKFIVLLCHAISTLELEISQVGIFQLKGVILCIRRRPLLPLRL